MTNLATILQKLKEQPESTYYPGMYKTTRARLFAVVEALEMALNAIDASPAAYFRIKDIQAKLAAALEEGNKHE